ncbi:Stc1 domain-containing protein [Chaetomium fimeti]|uniref:Stc1 domain-containing protein n=1 Tax=Chaetomium fimeti TaxID=1854472 RepID=A0AAE0HD88_9PEZI|nr:Stc1 domain-containing protein [Chaetomium fimeti]
MASERLRCQQGEWKTREHFSNRQLNKYDREARYAHATPSKTGIRCIEHSNKPAHEMQCKGPCHHVRDKKFFSKNTIRSGTQWCVDCTDWKLRTENGEALPAPGAQLSAEEVGPPSRDRAAVESYDVDLNEVESSIGTEDDRSERMSTLGGTESISETESVQYGNWSDNLNPMHLGQVQTRAPHWLIPDMGGRPTWSRQLATGTSDSISVASSSDMTATERPAGREPVPFNAWGPNGEYARMVKTPTVASGSARTGTTTPRQPVEQNKSGWAKVPSRKHAPQLPDYLKAERVDGGSDNSDHYSDGDSDGLDMGSDSDIYAN